jgi:ABC-2 type transport system permease protein
VWDQSGLIYESLRTAVAERKGWSSGYASRGDQSSQTPPGFGSLPPATDLGVFRIEKVEPGNRSLLEIKNDLIARVLNNRLDSFVIVPEDVLSSGRVDYYSRTAGDPIGNEQFDDFLRRAIIEQRLARAGITQSQLREVISRVETKRIQLTQRGEEQVAGAAFLQVMSVGLVLFVTLLAYSGSILSAVSEEKESCLAEVLFSSVRSFTLLLGKLVGVSLVAFTQYFIWTTALLVIAVFGSAVVPASNQVSGFAQLPGSFYLYLVAYFLVGYFIYATIYTVVGAMASSAEDSSWAALLVTIPLLLAFTMAMPVMRSPNSWMAIVASFVPFFSPILMPIRLVTLAPPAWQVLLALVIGLITCLLLLRLAARVYHTGMLMYGKKVTIPEVWRWLRQS